MEKKGRIIKKIVLISISAMAFLTVVLTVIGILQVRSTFIHQIEKTLKVADYQLADEFTSEYDGDWSYEDGTLFIGGESESSSLAGQSILEEYTKQMDALKNNTELEYTIFWDDTRIATTVIKAGTTERAVGTKASDKVIETVLKKGENFLAENIDIQGANYYGYYIPLKNSDGSIVGMIFTGTKADVISKAVGKTILIMGGVSLVILAILLVLFIMVERAVDKVMSGVSAGLQTLSSGDLSKDIDDTFTARTDDLGALAANTKSLIGQLRQTIGVSVNLSENVANSGEELSRQAKEAVEASGQVSFAIEDIAKGAIHQAESIQTAMADTNEIGNDIDLINDSVAELSQRAEEMRSSCESSLNALNTLIAQNEKVIESVGLIDAQIRATNTAVKDIAIASDMITEISSQTNLLSLNASIEAARAGESGRGFAVVASEIGQLADQSGQAAVKINKIVENLVSESDKSVEKLQELTEEFKMQNAQLDNTKEDMYVMDSGVKSVFEGTENINVKVDALNIAKNSLVDIIGDLSAISEENAASTEQTNASMQELNATFNIINEYAINLKDLAGKLDQEMKFFNL